VIAPAEPAALVRCGQQRLDLRRVEVADVLALMAFGGDGHHPGDRLGVLGMLQGGVPEEGVDRRQPVVARAATVAAIGLQVGEEGTDQRRIEVCEVQLEGLLAGLLVGVGE